MSAEGSSYIRSQSPGAERLAGLSLTLFRNSEPGFELRIRYTSWSGASLIEGAENERERGEIEWYANLAVEGIKAFAAERNIDLSAYTIEMHRFLYHPLDTKAAHFKRAGRNAFAAAWAALHDQDL